MSQQTINVGTTGGDGTGDPIRTAFTKTKANFAELYARSHNFVDTYGAVSSATENNPTANETAWNNFISYAVTESAAGRAVVLYIPPGHYRYRGSNIYSVYNGRTWYNHFQGIKKLTIIGYGATIENIYNYDANPNSGHVHPFPFQGQMINNGPPEAGVDYWPLNDVAANQNTAQLITTSDYTDFTVGEYYMVTSTNPQPSGGYPYNHDRWDYVICTAAYSNGQLRFDRNFKTDHYANNGIDRPAGSGFDTSSARIWNLQGAWDIDHLYMGFTVLRAPNYTMGDSFYQVTAGKRVTFIDTQHPGIAPQYGMIHRFHNVRITEASEPDKNIDNLVLTDSEIQGVFGISSPYGNFYAKNCLFSKGFRVGAGKLIHLVDCDIDEFSYGNSANLGRNRRIIVEGGNIRRMTYWRGNFTTQNSMLEVRLDPAYMTYANGLFTFNRSTTPQNYYCFSAVVGQKVSFVANTGDRLGLAPDGIGSGVITSITQNATHAFVQTTMPQASWPTWASNTLMRQECANSIRFENVKGCVPAKMFSRATELGVEPEAYWGGEFTGRVADFYLPRYDSPKVKEIRVNVVRAGPSGAILNMLIPMANATPSGISFPYVGDMSLNFDLATVGERIWTTTSINKLGSDSATFNSGAITTLPTDKIAPGTSYYSFSGWTPSTTQYHLTPTFYIDMIYDHGGWFSQGPIMYGNSSVSPLMYDGNT